MKRLITTLLLITLSAPAQAGLLGEAVKLFTGGAKVTKNLISAKKPPLPKLEPISPAQKLKQNMGYLCKPNWQAHHIIPVELIAHAALQKCGYDINQANNGICLPDADGDTQLPKHKGYHSNYNQAVKDAFDAIPTNLNPADTCATLGRIQSCLLQGIAQGLPLYGDNAKTAWQHCR